MSGHAHDPLCPMWSKVWAGNRCDCDFIAKVRADQTQRCIEIVRGYMAPEEAWKDAAVMAAWESAEYVCGESCDLCLAGPLVVGEMRALLTEGSE